MRVLLTSHQPFRCGAGGTSFAQWFDRLSSAGHDVRAVIAGEARVPLPGVRTVVCSVEDADADLPYVLPSLDARPDDQHSFAALTAAQLGAYREAFRAAFDAEVDAFDPEIVHAQHLWLDGHLALESGAPYVVTAYRSETATAAMDLRFARFVQETAENAGYILVGDSRLQADLMRQYELPTEQFVSSELTVTELLQLYGAVSDARFGRR